MARSQLNEPLVVMLLEMVVVVVLSSAPSRKSSSSELFTSFMFCLSIWRRARDSAICSAVSLLPELSMRKLSGQLSRTARFLLSSRGSMLRPSMC